MRNVSLVFRKLQKTLLLVVFLVSSGFVIAQAQDAANGKALFQAKCTSCHALDYKVIGPPLKEVVPTKSEEFLLKWIKNAPALIASGDAEAVEASKYAPSQMTPFPNLTDAQIKDIITYVKEGDKPAAGAAGATATDATATAAPEGVSTFGIIAAIIAVVAAIVILFSLSRASKAIERIVDEKEGNATETEVSFADRFKGLAKSKKFVFFVALCLILVLGSLSWVTMWNTNVETGYMPEQPIKFSHELHAGTNQIECRYCHSGAYSSRHASIPSLNVCMNCHKAVQAREANGGQISPEIQKIYTALGYNPDSRTYDESKQKPVQWVKVHNLPDLAYFNHSQHVVVGEKAIREAKGIDPKDPVCYACHGPVKEMKEMYQYSPLTMKWCINCHKEAAVDGKDNAYYTKLIAAHEKINKGEKVTVADMGGIECGKCHY